eukprot:2863593-Amphidinium_carterae.2
MNPVASCWCIGPHTIAGYGALVDPLSAHLGWENFSLSFIDKIAVSCLTAWMELSLEVLVDGSSGGV